METTQLLRNNFEKEKRGELAVEIEKVKIFFRATCWKGNLKSGLAEECNALRDCMP